MTLLALHICSTVHLLRLLLLLLLSTRFCFLCGPARQGDIRSAIAIALTLMCVFINTKTTKQSECHDTFCLWPVSLVLLNLMNKCHGEEEPFSCSAWQGTEGASEIFLLCLFVLPFFFVTLHPVRCWKHEWMMKKFVSFVVLIQQQSSYSDAEPFRRPHMCSTMPTEYVCHKHKTIKPLNKHKQTVVSVYEQQQKLNIIINFWHGKWIYAAEDSAKIPGQMVSFGTALKFFVLGKMVGYYFRKWKVEHETVSLLSLH